MTLENAREHKSNWIAANWFKLSVLLLSIGAISLFFYWHSIRPAQIKQACSWVKKHSNAIQSRKGMTEEELKAKGMIKACPPTPTMRPNEGYLSQWEKSSCVNNNREVIKNNKPQKYVPAKEWYVKATKEEYTFCLHDKGL
jgi:hypothetical protein